MKSVIGAAVFFLVGAISGCSGPPATQPRVLPKKAKAAPAPAPALAASPALVGLWDVRWHRCKTGWKPPTLVMRLRIKRKGKGLTVELSSPVVSGKYSVKDLKVKGDRLEATFIHDKSKLHQRIWATVRGNRLVGEMSTKGISWTPLIAHRLTLAQSSAKRPLTRGNPAKMGIDKAALDTLLERAVMERTSALVILKDGKIIVERYRESADRPLFAMSASKSVVSMAVGHLIASGKLSLDTRVSELFPRWKKGPRAAITVRHLLNNTSGLALARASWTKKETIVEKTLVTELLHRPGTVWQYNNGGVDFLAAVIKRASGMHLDAYLDKHLFEPMGIKDASWMKDRKGTPSGAGALSIEPFDLAMLGQLMLDNGKWGGEQLLPASWIEQSIKASQPMKQDYGLLWWRIGDFVRILTEPVLAAWGKMGVPEESLKKARVLLGERFKTYKEYRAAVEKALGKEASRALYKTINKQGHSPPPNMIQAGKVHGFAARGWKGQYLVVVPEAKLVAVRMRWRESVDSQWSDIDYYPKFEQDVLRLVGLAGSTK